MKPGCYRWMLPLVSLSIGLTVARGSIPEPFCPEAHCHDQRCSTPLPKGCPCCFCLHVRDHLNEPWLWRSRFIWTYMNMCWRLSFGVLGFCSQNRQIWSAWSVWSVTGTLPVSSFVVGACWFYLALQRTHIPLSLPDELTHVISRHELEIVPFLDCQSARTFSTCTTKQLRRSAELCLHRALWCPGGKDLLGKCSGEVLRDIYHPDSVICPAICVDHCELVGSKAPKHFSDRWWPEDFQGL